MGASPPPALIRGSLLYLGEGFLCPASGVQAVQVQEVQGAALLNSCQCLTIGEWLALLEAEGGAKPMRMGNTACRNIVMQAESQLAIGTLLLHRRHG